MQEVLMVAIAALSGVVAILFGLLIRYHQDTTVRLGECESDREKLWRAIGRLRRNGKKPIVQSKRRV